MDEFDYGSSHTRSVSVIFPCFYIPPVKIFKTLLEKKKMLVTSIFGSSEHEVLCVSSCDYSPSVVVVCRRFTFPCLRARIYRYQPISTKLVKIYMTMRSRMSSIMGLIAEEHLELSDLELKKIAIFHFVYTLASTNINQSALIIIKIYMTIRSRISSILGLFGPE